MGKSLKNFLNPLGKTNPLRPDNFTKNTIALAKNPFSKVAQHRSYGDYDYEKTLGGDSAAATTTADSAALASGIGAVGADALAAQAALAPQQYALEAQYRTLYSGLANNLVGSALLGGTTTSSSPNPVHLTEYNRVQAAGDTRSYDQWWADHRAANPDVPDDGYVQSTTTTPGMLDTLDTAALRLQGTQNATDSSARAAGLADLQKFGSAYNDAWRAANPQLSGLQDKLYSDATSGSDLLRTLKTQTLEDLQKGGKLGADELRDVQQSVRSAYGSRGLAGSNAAIFAEALNRTRYSDARRAAAQQNALNVDNYATGLTREATTTLKNTSFNPQSILDQSGTGLTAGMGAYSMAAEQSTNAGPTIFNPYSSEIMSYYAGQDANQTASEVADKNAKSAKQAGYVSAGAGIATAAIVAI